MSKVKAPTTTIRWTHVCSNCGELLAYAGARHGYFSERASNGGSRRWHYACPDWRFVGAAPPKHVAVKMTLEAEDAQLLGELLRGLG